MIPIDNIISAVKAVYPDAYPVFKGDQSSDGFDIAKGDGSFDEIGFGRNQEPSGYGNHNSAWRSAFSHLTPEQKALAVECPACEVMPGEKCKMLNVADSAYAKSWMHSARIVRVLEREGK